MQHQGSSPRPHERPPGLEPPLWKPPLAKLWRVGVESSLVVATSVVLLGALVGLFLWLAWQ